MKVFLLTVIPNSIRHPESSHFYWIGVLLRGAYLRVKPGMTMELSIILFRSYSLLRQLGKLSMEYSLSFPLFAGKVRYVLRQ